ncbi:MAG: leucine-rich repeat protein [Clostridia bacterium]|nr:leucine-rich repeat protein [Clostridia bacterium]
MKRRYLVILALAVLIAALWCTAAQAAANEVFTTQPTSKMRGSDRTFVISWETSFVPAQVQILKEVSGGFSIVDEITDPADLKQSMAWPIPMHYEPSATIYYVRLCNAAGEWFMSESFRNDWYNVGFTVKPTCGYLYAYEDFRIDFEPSFKPLHSVVLVFFEHEVGHQGGGYHMFVPLSEADEHGYILRCYYGDGSYDYIESGYHDFDWDSIKFYQEPTVSINDAGDAFRVSWETSFRPDTVSIYRHMASGDILLEERTDNHSRTQSYELPFAGGSKTDQYIVTATFNGNKSRTSQPFTRDYSLMRFLFEPPDALISPDGYHTVAWQTSFRPVLVEIGTKLNSDYLVPIAALTEEMNPAMTYRLSGLGASRGEMWVRAYYAINANGFYTESSFNVEKDYNVKFNTKPSGGNVYHHGTFHMAWFTNFKPWMYRVLTYNEDGSFCKLAASVISTEINPYTTFDLPWDMAGEGAGKVVIEVFHASDSYLRAECTVNKVPCVITFDPEGGRCDVTTAAPDAQGRLTSLPVPTRTGHAFRGWYYNYGGNKIAVNTQTVFRESTTLHAEWVPIEHRITVVNGTSSTYLAHEGQLFTITADEIPGMIFQKWILSGGNAQIIDYYSRSTLVQMGSGNTAMQATYKYVSRTVTFDANGGTVSPATATTNGQGKLTSLPVPTREGYTFNHWFIPTAGGSQTVTANTVFTEDTTVFASWSAIYRTVEVVDGTADRTSAQLGQVVTVTANERPNLAFVRWTVVTGGVTLADPNSASTTFVMGNAPVTVRAYYTYSGALMSELYVYAAEPELGAHPAAPTVTTDAYNVYSYQWFDEDHRYGPDAMPLMPEDVFENGKTYTIVVYIRAASEDLRIDPSVVCHINDSTEGVSSYYQSSFQVGMEKTFTVADYTVTFDANGGTGSMAPAEHVGQTYTLPVCGFEPPEDYVFDGWDAGQPGEIIDMTGDLTLTAQWRQVGGPCGDNVRWHLYDDGTLVISGTGPMMNYSTSAGYRVPWYDRRSDVTAVVIEDGVTTVGSYSFYYCQNLADVSLPGSLTSISSFAFQACSALTELTLPEGLTSIGQCAFTSCRNLNPVTLPASLTEAGGNCFSHSSVSDVTVLNPETVFTNETFLSHTGTLTLHGWPGSTAEAHAAVYNYIEFEPFPNGALGENVTWILSPTGALKISGTGSMYDYAAAADSPLYAFRDQIRTAEIGDGVTSIGKNVFAGCAQMTTVIIPESVSALGDDAFLNCASLNHVSVPYGVAVAAGFRGCTGLTEITLPYSIVAVSANAFSGCTGLSDLDFVPDGVKYLRSGAFRGCTGLTNVFVPLGVTTIESNVFRDCTNLASVAIHRGVQTVQTYAFDGSGLETVFYEGVRFEWDAVDIREAGNAPLLGATVYCKSAVIFDSRGGTEVPMQALNFEECAEEPAEPVRYGYLFGGWYADADCAGEPYDFTSPVYGDITLYARWLSVLVLPDSLKVIEAGAFEGIAAEAVVIPPCVTAISGNPFAGSAVRYIYGCAGSAAEDLANAVESLTFVPVSADWIAAR